MQLHTQGCTDPVRDSELKVDSGGKICCRTRDSNPHQYCTWLFSRTATNWVIPALSGYSSWAVIYWLRHTVDCNQLPGYQCFELICRKTFIKVCICLCISKVLLLWLVTYQSIWICELKGVCTFIGCQQCFLQLYNNIYLWMIELWRLFLLM